MSEKLQFRVKSSVGTKIVSSLTGSSTVEELIQICLPEETASKVQAKIRLGFPPKSVPVPDPSSETLFDLGVKNGDSLHLELSEKDANQKSSGSSSSGPASRKELTRKVVPADNSCLFTSVQFCLSGEIQVSAERTEPRPNISQF